MLHTRKLHKTVGKFLTEIFRPGENEMTYSNIGVGGTVNQNYIPIRAVLQKKKKDKDFPKQKLRMSVTTRPALQKMLKGDL